MSLPPRPKGPAAVFTQGSILRHVLVMTATGSLGLMAIFFVDFLSLLYVSWLNDPVLTAGVGYATQISFFFISINIGLVIAMGAVVSRAIGAGDRMAARRLAASGLVHVSVISIAISIIAFPLREDLLALLGAKGEALRVASTFLALTLPSNVGMGVGICLAAVLRSVGDARRSMYLTLAGAAITAIADPILIFGLGMGVNGAAISTILARIVFLVFGFHAVIRVHQMLERPQRQAVIRDLRPVMAIAIPAIVTNLATPFATSYAMLVFSRFGEPVVAAFSIIDRLIPVAFGVLFAMSGAIGPVIGQNFGAGSLSRVRDVLSKSFMIAVIYVASVWLIMWIFSPQIVALFHAQDETARLVIFFCTWCGAAWMGLGCLFVANSAFNNLGFPMLSTAFNWGRATLGTIPFVYYGSQFWGPEGAQLGIFLGAIGFGVGAIFSAYWVTNRLQVSRSEQAA